jgi:hypothetical protein
MDLGLPGLLAYVTMVVLSLGLMVAVLRRSKDGWHRCQAAGILGALTAVWVHGLFDAVLWGTKPSFLMWWLLGLAMTVSLSE